jgi:hypothetical protein
MKCKQVNQCISKQINGNLCKSTALEASQPELKQVNWNRSKSRGKNVNQYTRPSSNGGINKVIFEQVNQIKSRKID